jgi:hypothetical protein
MRASRPARPAPASVWLGPACGWLAFGVPLVVTLLRLSVSSQWRDDLAVVRGLGLVPVGGEGVLSGLLMQLAGWLPVGGRLMRASLVSAVALAVAGRLVFAVARRLLDGNARTPALSSLLALAAALTATLAPTWQLEGTIAGGATSAAALALLAVLLRPRSDMVDARVWFGYGLLAAVTALESHAAGAVLLLGLGAQTVVVSDVPPRRSVALFATGAAVAGVLCLAPMVVRPLAAHAWVHLGYGLFGSSVAGVDGAAEQSGALRAWLHEVGPVSLGIAGLGALWGVLRQSTRWLTVPLLALVVSDLLFPAGRVALLVSDSLSAVRLLAVGAVAVLAALGVHTLVVLLRLVSIPMARPAAALLVLFNFTLVLLAFEDSAMLADRRSQRGAEVWTDEALSALPPHSLLLVRSEAIAWRLWAARIVRGERSDLVVVPLHLLERGSVAERLLRLEPGLARLIREVAVNGSPGEYALSTLADSRPLYMQLDPAWDRRLLDHLIPEPLWLRFAPHALGHSDRRPSLRRGRVAFRRVLAAANTPEYRDEATLAVLAERAREQAAALAAVGDIESVRTVLADLKSIDPTMPFIAELEQLVAAERRRRINVAALFRQEG